MSSLLRSINAPRIVAEPVSFTPSTGAVMMRVARHREPAVLDSASPDPTRGRYTILTCEPAAIFSHRARDGDPFEAMRQRLAASGMLAPLTPDARVPFAGGWIGYFAYEAGRWIERLPATVTQDVGLPAARFCLYDSAAVFDHLTGSWTIVAADWGPLDHAALGGPCRPTEPARRIAWWKGLLAEAADLPDRPGRLAPPVYGRPRSNMSQAQYLRMVQRGREYIAAGDIFQANLARRESVPAVEEPLELYLRLRQTNPGVYSAFLAWEENSQGGRREAGSGKRVTGSGEREAGDGERQAANTDARSPIPGLCAVLSSSPELFLDLQGRDVVTRPIKGTRPRSADPARDESMRLELAASDKDRAELAMIVDLERNDLGRVCEFGSVRVISHGSAATPFALERHPTVHHLVATVTGRLAEGRNAIDLLRASFPGGSITGAPKVRAMEIIDELEPTERSVYTGAVGYFTFGRMTMNIAIRTLIQSRGMLHWYAGGGIVADSEPSAEYDETVAKALGLRRALGMEETCEMRTAER